MKKIIYLIIIFTLLIPTPTKAQGKNSHQEFIDYVVNFELPNGICDWGTLREFTLVLAEKYIEVTHTQRFTAEELVGSTIYSCSQEVFEGDIHSYIPDYEINPRTNGMYLRSSNNNYINMWAIDQQNNKNFPIGMAIMDVVFHEWGHKDITPIHYDVSSIYACTITTIQNETNWRVSEVVNESWITMMIFNELEFGYFPEMSRAYKRNGYDMIIPMALSENISWKEIYEHHSNSNCSELFVKLGRSINAFNTRTPISGAVWIISLINDPIFGY